MKKVLVWIYEDILKFHLRAWRIFSQHGKQILNLHDVVAMKSSDCLQGGKGFLPQPGKTFKKASSLY